MCQLITLINGLTGKNIDNINIIEKIIPREIYHEKEIQLDILAETNKGERINLESQYKNVDMNPRDIYYMERILVESVQKKKRLHRNDKGHTNNYIRIRKQRN